MLDDAYEKRNGYIIELALMKPRWGLHRLARETNKVFGTKHDAANWRDVEKALDDAGVEKINGRWQRVEK